MITLIGYMGNVGGGLCVKLLTGFGCYYSVYKISFISRLADPVIWFSPEVVW